MIDAMANPSEDQSNYNEERENANTTNEDNVNITLDATDNLEEKVEKEVEINKDHNNNNVMSDELVEEEECDRVDEFDKESLPEDGVDENIHTEKQAENEMENGVEGDTTERPASAPGSANFQDTGIENEPEERQKGDGEEEPNKTPTPIGTASTLHVKSAARKHTTTPADDSGLAQPILPAIPRGQVKVQQIASSISDARKKDCTVQPTVYPIRSRVPPKLVRLATVTVSPVKSRPAPHGPSLYYEEPKRPQKVITWDQANNARPPLRIDMEGPGPCSYSPLNKPLNETNAPSYTFGTKCYHEKPTGVGSRTSWAKSWFQSSHPYHHKADYVREGLWPSPTHYPKPKTLGARQRTFYESPSYTFGHKAEFSIIKPGAHKEPSPTDYERQTADSQVLKRGPSYSHQFRREGTILWGCTESNPGPAAYTPSLQPRQQKPSFTIQGIRRSKSHLLGPFSTI